MFTHIIIGLSIGLAGSFHCIGMCGPLALSLPLNHQSRFSRLASIALYNLGRAITYFLLGLLFGGIGNSLFLTGYQQAVSVFIGILILVMLIGGSRLSPRIGFVEKFHQKIKVLLGNLLMKEKNVFSYLLIGLVNGLLPCGLVYLAISSAVAAGSVLGGGLLMLAFGLGTIPLMFALMIAGRHVSIAVRQKMRRLVPVFVGVMACLMILRGMGLGIPYISPAFAQAGAKPVMSCCSKDSIPGHIHKH